MSNQELLGLAAKAMGVGGSYVDMAQELGMNSRCGHSEAIQTAFGYWNPLESQSDAFGLMTELELTIIYEAGVVTAVVLGQDDCRSTIAYENPIQRLAATMRAITECAANLELSRCAL